MGAGNFGDQPAHQRRVNSMQQDRRSIVSEPLSSETLSSGPMMRELRRWTKPTRTNVIHHRWAEWARSLSQQHRLATARRGAPSMTFVHPATLVKLRERLMSFSLNLYSRMSLAIHPILREVRLSQEKASRARAEKLNASSASSRSDAIPVPAQAADSITRNEAGLRLVTAAERRSAIEYSGKSNAMLTGANQAGPSNAGDYSTNDMESLPRGLSLVFRRLHQFDEFTATERRRNTIHESVENLALNLVKKSQRVEQMVSSNVAAVARQSPPPKTQQVAPQVVTTEHTAQHMPGMFRAQQQSWAGNAAELPDVVVEQLTERVIRQIDHRAVAWRERTGKI